MPARPSPGLADHLEPAAGQGQAQQLAQVVGVVDDHDPHGSERWATEFTGILRAAAQQARGGAGCP